MALTYVVLVVAMKAAPALTPVQFKELGITLSVPEGLEARASARGALRLEGAGLTFDLEPLVDELPVAAAARRQRIDEILLRTVAGSSARDRGAWRCAESTEDGESLVACIGKASDGQILLARLTGASSRVAELGGAGLVVAVASSVRGVRLRPLPSE